MNGRRFRIIGLLSLLILLWVSSAFAGWDKDSLAENQQVILKKVTGTVSYLDGKYIAVVYEKDKDSGDEYEIGFFVQSDLKLQHKRKLSDIKRGDTVQILYEELQEEYEEVKDDGKKEMKTKIVDRQAKALTFIKPARGDLTSG